MFRKMLVPLLAVGLVGIVTAQQEVVTIDTLMNSRIREEGMKNSQIMRTMHYLTDVHGPRLTGSPNHENAAKWAVAEMERWGIDERQARAVGLFEGRQREDSARGLAERKSERPHPLAGQGQPGVRGAGVDAVDQGDGERSGRAHRRAAGATRRERRRRGGGGAGRGGQQRLGPTADEMKSYLATLAPKMKGAIVLVGAHTWIPFQETPPAKRQTEEAARGRYNQPPPDPNAQAGRAGRGGGGAGRGGAPAARRLIRRD